MTNFDDFKQKAKETVGVIADASVELYKIAEEKTKILAKTAKLQAENSGDRNSIKKLYTEIGKLYYAKYRDDTKPELDQNCAEITAAFERITNRLIEIENLKKASPVDDEPDYDEDAEDAETEPADDAADDDADSDAEV
jgi:hypothetical protein